MDQTALDKLSQDAAKVAAQHQEQTEAVGQETQAEAALLSAVVVKIKPALRALCSRIVKEYVSAVNDAGIANGRQSASREYFKPRGLLIASTELESSKNTGTRYERCRELYLMEDGTFAVCIAEESKTQWVGSSDTTTRGELTPIEDRLVAEKWKLDYIITAITEALQKQLEGKSPERTAAAHKRAEHLAALAKLI